MKTLLICCISLMCLSACSPIYYSANTQNVPLLSGNKDLSVNVAGNDDRLEVQAAYAVDEHVGVMLNNGFYFPRKADNGDGGSGQFFEGGVGYFHSLGNNMIWELYGLTGYGHVQNSFPSTRDNHPNTTGTIDANIFRYGVQPALGYRTKYFEGAVSARLAGMNYSGVSGSMVYDSTDQVNYLRTNRNHFLVEPAITLRTGTDFLKLQFQVGTSFNVTDPDFRQDKEYATLGLIFRPFAPRLSRAAATLVE